MPWRIGIDEAGYGPNLGPFVMTAVACRSEAPIAGDLWQALRSAVRKAKDGSDDRLLIDDSKKVYSSGKGLAQLERAALTALGESCATLADLVARVAVPCRSELANEVWFRGTTAFPCADTADALQNARQRWHAVAADLELAWLTPVCEIVCAPRFNDLIDRYDTKGAILGLGFVRLLQELYQQTSPEPVNVVVDKHGGRNHYGALVQHAFPDGWVVPREETGRRGIYDVLGLDRSVTVTFQVEADGCDMNVALASMISKFLREALMAEWNAFWAKEVPGIEPTAGYPTDALRFMKEIRPALERLGLDDKRVWRRR